jgi:hypothetical protein
MRKYDMRQLAREFLEGHVRQPLDECAHPDGRVLGHGGTAGLAKQQLFGLASQAQSLHDRLDDSDELPEWIQAEIAVMADKMDSVASALDYKLHVADGSDQLADDGGFSYTGDVSELPGEEAFGVGYEAGKRGLE